MEALTTEIMRMIDELQSMNDWQNAHPLDLDGEDTYGFKFEAFNAYSTEPLSFTETAMKLETEARKVFKMVRILNRQSPLFMQLSGHLEKLVSQLGSACITKAVMEQRGENSPVMDNMLYNLTIDSLRGMTALNFRKCYDSYMESQTNYRVNPGALALSIRWSALDRRLLATKEKIELIKSGKIKVDVDDSRTNGDGFCRPGNEPEGTVSPADSDLSGVALRGQSPEPEGTVTSVSADQITEKESKLTPLSAKGRALPIDKAAIRGMEKQSPEDTRPEIPELDTAVDGFRRLSSEPEGIIPPADLNPSGNHHRSPGPEPGMADTPDSVPPETAAEASDPYDNIGDEYDDYDDDYYEEQEGDLPYPSEDPVRRMSEYWQQHLPQYEYARKT